jgi:hypothetical protein
MSSSTRGSKAEFIQAPVDHGAEQQNLHPEDVYKENPFGIKHWQFLKHKTPNIIDDDRIQRLTPAYNNVDIDSPQLSD